MDLAIVVYLIGLIGNLGSASSAISFCAVVALGVAAVVCVVAHNSAHHNYDSLPNSSEAKAIEVSKKFIKISSITLIVSIIINVIVPSKTDMYIMTGLVVGEKVITSEKGNELLDKSYLYVVNKIDDAIVESTKVDEVDKNEK